MTLSHDLLHELKKRFRGDLRLDPASKILYSTDASIYQIEPLGVAIPRTQDDLQAAVELAVKYKIPILPRGSGTSLGGQAIGEALILDCSRYLDSIIEIDPEAQSATVEPGVILSSLNRAASKYGLMFGPDPASAERATMGGVIGNNATGAHSILYGMSADHLISADVILSDGSLAKFDDSISDIRPSHSDSRMSKIVSTMLNIRENYSEVIQKNFPKSWRNSAGYRLNYLLPWSPSVPPRWHKNEPYLQAGSSALNLAPLLAGSEGTLAVTRQLTVNLVGKQKHTILGVLAYQSIVSACEDVPRLLSFSPSAIELIPRMILRFARGVPAYARQMGWMIGDPAAILVIEFSGNQLSALRDAVRNLADVITIAESPEQQARIWNIRKMGLGILDSRPGAARPAAFIEDCAVPVQQLGEFVREIEKILAAHKVDGGIYGHASGGCLHIRPILNLQSREGVSSLRSISEEVFAVVMRLGGSMSSEHGDGIVSGEWIEKTYGAEVTAAMRMLKQAADPYNLLNPKKMLDAPPMDAQLRQGENYRPVVWNSSLHFDHELGLSGAIEQCNGQGVCRKDFGVMCPSFQATRDEALSTRGRANLLRGMINGSSSEGSTLSAEDVFSSLDLCLACKGCTAECPSGVDMPRLKYEFMNKYYETHRRRMRDYLFGYFHVAASWLMPVAPLVNPFMKMKWSKMLMARMLGITEKREFPIFVKRKKSDGPASKPINAKTVIFLSDVFSRFLEPEVEQAAFDILHRLGYKVKTLSVVGAGASLLSKGFISAARRHAEKVIAEIKLHDAGAGLSVVGCEPPEVYCLKHEYISLMPDRRDEIVSITKAVWMVEEFILRVPELSRVLSKKPPEQNRSLKKVTFHPHCHQRAEGPTNDGLPSGTSATVELLQRVGFEVHQIEAGCCGMAGTFGYDTEHYELSMQVGELAVLPRLRERGGQNHEIVSTGAACRIQIRHGAGLEAKHPLVLVRDALAENDGEDL